MVTVEYHIYLRSMFALHFINAMVTKSIVSTLGLPLRLECWTTNLKNMSIQQFLFGIEVHLTSCDFLLMLSNVLHSCSFFRTTPFSLLPLIEKGTSEDTLDQ